MNQLAFENQLKIELDWHTQGVTEEEYTFICEQASYMSDRDRVFFLELLQKMMRVYQ